MGLEERLRKAEHELERRMAELEQETQARIADVDRELDQAESAITGVRVETPSGVQRVPFIPLAPRPDMRVDMTYEQSLYVLDDIMEADFDLQQRLGGSLIAYPTTYCETPREYLEPILANMPMADAQRDAVLDQVGDAAEQGVFPPVLTSLGMHIPGVGCFINGWYMAREAAATPREYFQSGTGFAQIVTTAAHEKWGHGFISELTALGQEKASVQLGMHHIADQFEIQTVDTPDHARLQEQWAILFFSSNFVEEGYATWIQRYLAQRLAEREPEHAERLLDTPHFSIEGVTARLRANQLEVADHVDALFVNGNDPQEIIEQWASFQKALDAEETAFAMACGLPTPYVVGYLMADRIAARQGPECLPYAVATACNIQYGLRDISNHDLRHYVETDPNLNVNARLALIMTLNPGEQNNVEGFLTRLRNELGLTPPIE